MKYKLLRWLYRIFSYPFYIHTVSHNIFIYYTMHCIYHIDILNILIPTIVLFRWLFLTIDRFTLRFINFNPYNII